VKYKSLHQAPPITKREAQRLSLFGFWNNT
jgi:hypothetical protein